MLGPNRNKKEMRLSVVFGKSINNRLIHELNGQCDDLHPADLILIRQPVIAPFQMITQYSYHVDEWLMPVSKYHQFNTVSWALNKLSMTSSLFSVCTSYPIQTVLT